MFLNLLRWLVCFLGRSIMALRYKVTFSGLEKLKDPQLRHCTLIVPNHPSLTEPILMIAHLWPYLHMRPMLFSVNFQHPLISWVPGLLRAVEVPVTDQLSATAREGAGKAVKEAIEGLRKGENHIMWPAGRIYGQPFERLGSASGLTEILREVPEAKVIMIRTRGMWGSSFGWAYTGTNPNLMLAMTQGIKAVLRNLIFFIPRRSLHVTIERLDRATLPELTKEKVNPFFEAWYNAEGPEEARYIPYHFLFGPRSYTYPPLADEYAIDFESIRTETRKAIKELLEERLKRPLDDRQCTAEARLDDLGLDSLDRMELAATVEGRFGFTSDIVPSTFGQLAALAGGLLASGAAESRPAPPLWFRESSMGDTLEVKGETVAEAFVKNALACRNDIAAADDTSGVLTYEKLLVSVRIMTKRVKKINNGRVGVLLPSSIACSSVFLAVHMAGKIPVMLNWTTGPGNLAHAAKVMELTEVITSRRFIDRLGIAIEGTRYIYLEDIKKEISKGELLLTFLSTHILGMNLERDIPHPAPDDTAVVLFTSGSEKAPKAVPLTHRNILSNIRSGLLFLKPSGKDSLLAILPPFHSFGLTTTLLLPLLTGLKVVHHADPTDSAGLVRKINAYRPTSLFLTPTFLSYILDRAAGKELESLVTVVTGAEKTPSLLFDRLAAKAPGAALYEGYGITECSPIVSMNAPGAVRRGTIGRAIPGVEIKVVSHESMEALPAGSMGTILVNGPSVFPGYLAYEGDSPFVEQEGKRWYNTQDMGSIDDEGYITFSGRLKRFLKAGGEMISLPALEEPLAQKYPATQDGPRVAVEGLEHEGGRTVVLFTTEELTAADANGILAEKGLKGIMRIDRVERVAAIPLLGTGKTDYKVLRKQIETLSPR